MFQFDFLFVRLCRSQEVLPVEYGTRYDGDLQMLFAEFVFRLNQLLPIPDMEQVRSAILFQFLLRKGKKILP